MYAPTLDTPLNTNLIPEGDTAQFPLVSIAGSQPNPSQTYIAIPTDSNTNGSMFPSAEGLITTVYETSHENYASQNPSTLEVTTTAFLPVPFAVPTPTCGLAGGLYCALPLDGSVGSVKLHLRTHGHRHPQRQTVQCPWAGCSHTLQWVNMSRHIQAIHLGIRFKCADCGKQYTRLDGLARHTASLKCNGAAGEEKERGANESNMRSACIDFFPVM